MSNDKILIQRIRRKNKQPKGVFAAKLDNRGCLKVGWSLCTRRDIFSMDFGKKIAMARLEKGSVKPIPHSITGDYSRFMERTKRYFKNYA